MRSRTLKYILKVFLPPFAALTVLSVYHAFASAADLREYPAPGRVTDAGGHRLHINCLGTGAPTVVLEAGMSGWSTDWALVQSDIARTTRVCAYDRAGYGWSDSGPRPRDSRQVTLELHTLLSRSGVDGDLVLVGHSLGGLFVQHYAKLHSEQVAGVVLVDSVHPEQSRRMKADVRDAYEGNLRRLTWLSMVLAPTGLLRLIGQPTTTIADKLPGRYRDMARSLGFSSRAYRALHDEMASFQRSQSEVQDAGPLPDVPLAVISSSLVQNFPPGFSADVKAAWDLLQADLARAATMPQVVATNSGHYIHIDQPGLVLQTVLEAVRMARSGVKVQPRFEQR